eukprot:jgi/Galph1/3333/GphlegSOOS_G1948.1
MLLRQLLCKFEVLRLTQPLVRNLTLSSSLKGSILKKGFCRSLGGNLFENVESSSTRWNTRRPGYHSSSLSSVIQAVKDRNLVTLAVNQKKLVAGIHLSSVCRAQDPTENSSKFATGSTLGSATSAAETKLDWRIRVRRAQRKRLYILVGGMLSLATVVYSTLYAFEDQLMYFLTPTQMLSKVPPVDPERRTRLGGVVVNGSFLVNDKEKKAEFVVTDLENEIPVIFDGTTFPDLFGEGKSVVAEGYLRNGTFYTDKILAKHDEYYIPKGVQESIERNPVSIYGSLKSATVNSRSY